MKLGRMPNYPLFYFFSYLLDKESWSAGTAVLVFGIIVYTLDKYSTHVLHLRASPIMVTACPGQLGQILPLVQMGVESTAACFILILSLFFSFIFSFIYSVGQIWLWQMRRNDQGYPRK